jgi:hypothetical protein
MSTLNPFTLDLNRQIKTGSVNSMLTRLFIEMLKTMNVDTMMYENRIDQYITNAGLPKNIKELSSVRGNIKKELCKPSMSWKVFLKSMVFLGVKEFKLSLHYKNPYNDILESNEQVYVFDYKTINMKLFGGTDRDKDEVEETNVLHSLYQKIHQSFIECGVTEQTMIENYVQKTMINTEDRDLSSIKGSMKKEISRGNMTWRVFIKGLCFLGIEHYVIALEVLRFDRKVFRVGFPVSMAASDIGNSDE